MNHQFSPKIAKIKNLLHEINQIPKTKTKTKYLIIKITYITLVINDQ